MSRKAGVVIMSSHYTRWEVPTKTLKNKLRECVCSCSLSALPAQVTHCPSVWLLCLFFVWSLIYPQLCVFTCVCVCMHNTLDTHAHGCRFVCVSANLAFCNTFVCVFRHNMPVFHCDCVFANVCDLLFETYQGCLGLGLEEEAQCVCILTWPVGNYTHVWF